MQVISQPLCSTSLHTLCTHSDPSANVVKEEEVFLTVCILFTTILCQSINVFSCPPTLLVRNKEKQTPIPKQLNALNLAAGKERGGKGWRGKDREGCITLKLFLFCSSGWAETAKYRIYQGRWTRKMTWVPHSKEQAINEVCFYLLSQKASKTKLICMSKSQLNKYSTHYLLPFRHVTMYIFSRQVSCLLPVCTIYKQDYKVHIKMERASLCGDSEQKFFRRKYACMYS